MDNQNILNSHNQDLIDFAKKHKSDYQNGSPFPNIAFDNFFNPLLLSEVLSEFPDLSKSKSQNFNSNKEVKLAASGELLFGPDTKKLMHFLNSEPFLKFLQILTGIEEPLISDPYFIGGGLHEIKRGGYLKIHADFNKHQLLDLDRRLNVLIYLNKNWKEEYGGHFELWDRNMKNCEKKILPSFNTMAIFSTTDFSYHGHPDQLACPENMSRKSLALYYYSNGRPDDEIIPGKEKHNTIFKGRSGNKDDAKAFRKTRIKTIVQDFTPPILFRKLSKLF